MVQLGVFAALVVAAGVACWYSRRTAVPVAFAVLFAIDGVYEMMIPRFGNTASLAAVTAIAFCALAFAMDRLSPEG